MGIELTEEEKRFLGDAPRTRSAYKIGIPYGLRLSIMWTLFFDIDGTLIKTEGAGMSAIAMAMFELFGIEELPNIPVQGRTAARRGSRS